MAKISIDKVTHKLTAVIYSKPRKTGRTEITADNADISNCYVILIFAVFSLYLSRAMHRIIFVINAGNTDQ